MSFSKNIIPRLGQSPENPEWYVEAMWQSLNEYMGDIENAVMLPQFLITGTTIVPGTPPVPVPVSAPVGVVIGNHVRLTYPEVKTAMWCGNGKLTFPNLFKLFANKLMLNFTTISSSTIVTGSTVFSFDAITPFNTIAQAFMSEILSIGTAGQMTPQIFHTTLDRYLNLALNSIIPVTVPYVGAGILPVGAFTGTATVSFQQVAVL